MSKLWAIWTGDTLWARHNGTTLTTFNAQGDTVGGPIVDPDGPAVIRRQFGDTVAFEASALPVGHYHPRIGRAPHSPPPQKVSQAAWSQAVQSARGLFFRMRELFRYVEPAPKNHAAYGQEMRHLLILACTEVEAAWRGVLLENDPSLAASNRLSTNDYVRLAQPMRLAEWKVRLRDFPEYPAVSPFQGWSAAQPTASLAWYQAYQGAKHDRETNFDTANLEHVIGSLAGVFVMVAAQFGSWSARSDWFDIGILQSVNAREVAAVQDFAVIEPPKWSLAERYAPPGVEKRTAWTAAPFFAPHPPIT
jgi:hypothetical protein